MTRKTGTKSDANWTKIGAIATIAAAVITIFAILIAHVDATSGASRRGDTTTPNRTTTHPPTSAAATASQPSAGTPAVMYTGQRDLSATFAADLDNPNWDVAAVSTQPAGADIYLDGSGNLSRYNGQWGILRSQGGDEYQECVSFTAFAASLIPVSGLGAVTRLCVRTSEGRLGMLTVRAVSGQQFNEIVSFDVIVWD